MANPIIRPGLALVWFFIGDPTTGDGVQAPLWQLGIRTDVASFYYKSGHAPTDWTRIGVGA